jgi:hypothetical protein
MAAFARGSRAVTRLLAPHGALAMRPRAAPLTMRVLRDACVGLPLGAAVGSVVPGRVFSTSHKPTEPAVAAKAKAKARDNKDALGERGSGGYVRARARCEGRIVRIVCKSPRTAFPLTVVTPQT